MDFPATSVRQMRWEPVSNASGEVIPAFAAMRVTGVGTDGIFTVAKPNTNDQTSRIFFNGPVKIAVGEKGNGTPSFPCKAAFDTGDGTPSAGDEWGVENNGWKLRNARSGFLIVGGVDSSGGHAVVEMKPTAQSLILVEEESGGVSVNATKIEFPDTSLIDDGSNVVSVRETDATHAGLVNLDTQVLGTGTKIIEGALELTEDSTDTPRANLSYGDNGGVNDILDFQITDPSQFVFMVGYTDLDTLSAAPGDSTVLAGKIGAAVAFVAGTGAVIGGAGGEGVDYHTGVTGTLSVVAGELLCGGVKVKAQGGILVLD